MGRTPAAIAAELLDLQGRDFRLRDRLAQSGQLDEGYHPAMRALHEANADRLSAILEEVGFPTAELLGPEAAAAAWTVVQHAISRPALQRRYQGLLSRAVAEHRADPVHLAMLTDRIAFLAGEPQLYGTQFDYDERGILVPVPLADPARVDERRAAVGLPPLAERLEEMRRQNEREGLRPPRDYHAKQAAFKRFRREVGWISGD